jgi:DNA mismatch endonuclease (patch repair protein)
MLCPFVREDRSQGQEIVVLFEEVLFRLRHGALLLLVRRRPFGFLHLETNRRTIAHSGMDTVSPQKRSRIMASIRSRGNSTTEIPLASAMRRLGLSGWRRHARIRTPSGSVRPDFVFRRERLAVFVSGCFWHYCPEHCSLPKSNSDFWRSKLEANRARDRRNSRELKSMGWEVLVIWEHSVKRSPAVCAESVLEILMWMDV